MVSYNRLKIFAGADDILNLILYNFSNELPLLYYIWLFFANPYSII